MENDQQIFNRLILRANLYIDFLEGSSNVMAFPDRAETRKFISQVERSGSLKRAENFNRGIDIHLIGKNTLSKDEKAALKVLFEEKLNEPEDHVKKKFLATYHAIVKKGKAKNQTEFLDGMEIYNSNDLGLTVEEKTHLKDILDGTLVGREIDRLKNLGIDLPE